jgi:hypothetical protein
MHVDNPSLKHMKLVMIHDCIDDDYKHLVFAFC